MRSLASALATALGAPVQQPAILVEIAFATTRRWTSSAAVTWNSLSWTREDVALEGLQVQALQLQGTLVIGNADDGIGALVLAEDVADRAIRIWGYDAAATATGDVVPLCDAVGGAATIDENRVRISLRSPAELLLAPRTFVGPAAGFNNLLPGGTVLKINGRDLRLDRRGG